MMTCPSEEQVDLFNGPRPSDPLGQVPGPIGGKGAQSQRAASVAQRTARGKTLKVLRYIANGAVEGRTMDEAVAALDIPINTVSSIFNRLAHHTSPAFIAVKEKPNKQAVERLTRYGAFGAVYVLTIAGAGALSRAEESGE